MASCRLVRLDWRGGNSPRPNFILLQYSSNRGFEGHGTHSHQPPTQLAVCDRLARASDLSSTAILGAFVVVGGVASVVADPKGLRMSPKDFGLGMLPNLFMGFTVIFIRLGMQALPDAILGGSVSSLTALLALLAMQKSIVSKERWGATWNGMKFFLIAGICYCAAFYTYHKALEFGEVNFAAPLVFMSPLITIAFSRVFLQSLETCHMETCNRGGYRGCWNLSCFHLKGRLIPFHTKCS